MMDIKPINIAPHLFMFCFSFKIKAAIIETIAGRKYPIVLICAN